MALQRRFVFNRMGQEIVLEDPDADMNPDDVRALYAHQYPELLRAAIVYHDAVEGEQRYEFNPKEGSSSPAVVKSGAGSGGGKVEFRPSIGRKG